jgi:hypothetical protein
MTQVILKGGYIGSTTKVVKEFENYGDYKSYTFKEALEQFKK